MGAFGGIDTSQGNGVISRTPKIRQPLFEVLAGGDAVVHHALSPPCVDVEVAVSRLQPFPHLEDCPGPQGQGGLVGGIGRMSFESRGQIFAIHDVQYRAPQAPAVAGQDGASGPRTDST